MRGTVDLVVEDTSDEASATSSRMSAPVCPHHCRQALLTGITRSLMVTLPAASINLQVIVSTKKYVI